jgi:hypothetical protein
LHLLRTERLWKRRDGKRAYRDPHLHHLKRQRGRPVDGVNLALSPARTRSRRDLVHLHGTQAGSML